MSYRNPNYRRMSGQAMQVAQYAGHVVTWKQYVSAVTANPILGLGDTYYYRQQLITAHMAYQSNSETQYGAGQMAGATLYATTRVKPSTRDELVWDGVVYRVDSQAQPSKFGGQWVTRLKRGDE